MAQRPRSSAPAGEAAPAPETAVPGAPGGQTIRIKLVKSPIGYSQRQRDTVRSLGLRKLHQVVEQADTPVTRGMVDRVRHLVQVIQE